LDYLQRGSVEAVCKVDNKNILLATYFLVQALAKSKVWMNKLAQIRSNVARKTQQYEFEKGLVFAYITC